MPPTRRQSFAPMSTAESFRPGAAKKRAVSFAPGEAARQLLPRKSILKNSQFTFNVPPPSQNSQGGDAPVEYAAQISDKVSQKGDARRVSFAEMAYFRLFNNDNTNSTADTSSSTVDSPDVTEDYAPPRPYVPQLSNENDYPGRRLSNLPYTRLSSVTDYGERSMSLDMDESVQMQQNSDNTSEPPTDPVFFSDTPNENGVDYDFGDFDDEDEDGDVEVTEAIALNINQKHSISVAEQTEAARTPLAPKRRPEIRYAENHLLADDDDDENYAEKLHRSRRKTRASQPPMDFTIALGQPLKEPEPPSDAWLALAAMASSVAKKDNDEVETNDEDMELGNALSRLRNARASFDLRDNDEDDSPLSGEIMEEASFTDSSMDDNMDNMDYGDRTINVTSLMGRVSNLGISGDEFNSNLNAMDYDDFARPVPLTETAPLNISRKLSAPVQEITTVATNDSIATNVPGPSSTANENEPRVENNPQMQEPAPIIPSKTPMRSSVFSAPVPTPSRIPVLSPSKSSSPLKESPVKKRPAPAFTVYVDPQPNPAKKRHIEDSTVAPFSQSQRINKPPVLTDLTPKHSEAPPSAAPSLRTSLGGALRRFSGFSFRRHSVAPGGILQQTSGPPLPDAQDAASDKKDAQEDQSEHMADKPSQTAAMDLAQDENIPAQPITELPALPPDPASSTNNQKPTVTFAEGTSTGKEPISIMDIETVREQPARPRLSTVLEVQSMDQDNEFEEDLPPISIKEFFLMTGVKFMGDLTAPRRSTIHPSQLNRRESTTLTIPSLSEFVMAMTVHFPQLELYSWVTKDLQLFIDNSKRLFEEAEDEVAKLTPSLFREFSQANDEGREELLHQLKLIKANRHNAAKEKWYEWKYQWVLNLLENVVKGISDLEKDKIILTNFIDQAEDILPALRQKHAQTLLELEKERKEVEEIENSDSNFLEELKGTIEEQNILLSDYRTEIAESTARLERLEEKSEELEAQKRENETAIAHAERRIILNKTSITTEVFKLKDELESLQIMHSWRISKLSQMGLELIFNEQFLVHVPCTKLRPLCAQISVSRLNGESRKLAVKKEDPFQIFSNVVVRQAQKVARKLSTSSLKKVLGVLGDFWSSCSQIHKQLTFLSIKYPLKIEAPLDGLVCIKVIATIVLRKSKSKVIVEYLFNEEVITNWPSAMAKLECNVKVAYGTTNPEEVQKGLLQRLSERSVANSHACLLDSIVDTIAQFDQ